MGETVGARVKVGRAVAGGGRLTTGDGSTRGRVAVGTLGGRVGVLTAIRGVADGAGVDAGVYVCNAVIVCGVKTGVGCDDANVAAGTGTGSLDVDVASGLTPRVAVADGPAGRDRVGDGAGGVTAHPANATPSQRISPVCLTFIHPSGLSKRLSTASVSQGKARAAAASVPHPGGMMSRRRG